jgi:hypothetical protein
MTKLEIDLDTTELKVGDVLVRNDGVEEIESLSYIRGKYNTPLFNFSLDGDNTYFANGYLVHNKGAQCMSCLIHQASSSEYCCRNSGTLPSLTEVGCGGAWRQTDDESSCSCCTLAGGRF